MAYPFKPMKHKIQDKTPKKENSSNNPGKPDLNKPALGTSKGIALKPDSHQNPFQENRSQS